MNQVAFTLALLAACGAASACPKAADVKPADVFGVWRAEFEGLPRGATLLIGKHPEDESGLRGKAEREGVASLLAGGVGQGQLNLEESYDGTRISAVWLGDVVEGSCGREIRGVWQEEKDPPRPYKFVLRKHSAW